MERAVLNPVKSEPGGGVELWASRALKLVSLPRSNNWHNPSLLEAVPESINEPNSNRPAWFWRVEPTFAVWVAWAIHRASRLQQTLPEAQCAALLTIRGVIEEMYPDDPAVWEKIEQRARSPDVAGTNAHDILPGMGLVRDAIGMAGLGHCSMWEGYERDAERFGRKYGEVVMAPTSAAASAEVSGSLTTRPESAVLLKSNVRSKATSRSVVVGPDLFSAN